ncbi:MAG TPA: UDP-N-acetylglucosamine 2-epimerase (non-hydrolyzing) [Acidimicrobiales bacterium]|jgi:UDP-N-acetylglucosamine 2-epimerase (non-hydrolysing)|nr:UDP-N-acetylglucosamine 2-epimerase (non-hydrolyzing) [Acidimicrobiales bacterium]
MTGQPLRVMTVVGTRPEIIRLSRVLARLDTAFDHTLVHTGQNYDHQLSQIFFDELKVRAPDVYLGVDTSTLGHVLGGILIAMEEVLLEKRPDVLLVLGDTNSSISAVMAKRLHVPVYHMEAGNRSFDANVPEEVNRRLVDHVADFNLAYTEHARRNLLAEGLHPRSIALSGSPMAEVLAYYSDLIDHSSILQTLNLKRHDYFLASAHREENVDDVGRLSSLVEMLQDVRRTYDLPILVSTHPRTRKRLDALGRGAIDGVTFYEPFGFFDYVKLEQNARCVLSDSGTISEESSILGFPAITLRDSIERPEALESGSIVSTGLSSDVVCDAIDLVLEQHGHGDPMVVPPGYEITNCSQRVVNFIRSTAHVAHQWSGVRSRPSEAAGS